MYQWISRQETVQQPLPYCTVLHWSLPHQEHKTGKREQRAGGEKEEDNRRAGSVRGAQHEDSRSRDTNRGVAHAWSGNNPAKQSMNIENAFFGLWQYQEDREA